MVVLNPRLRWAAFDAEFVAYHCDSGNTFLANGVAARIIAALRTGPLSEAALAEIVSPPSATDGDGAAAGVFDASLGFLRDLDAVLVEASD